MRGHLVRFAVLLATIGLAACDQGVNGFLGVGGAGNPNGRLQITPNVAQVSVGQTVDLQTNAALDLQNRVQWRSLNTSIATVSNTGRVTGLFPGVATIQARFSFDTTQAATASITVIGIGP